MKDERPTIEELEDILASNDDNLQINILPSGAIVAVKKGLRKGNLKPKILTLKQALTDSY